MPLRVACFLFVVVTLYHEKHMTAIAIRRPCFCAFFIVSLSLLLLFYKN